MYRGYSFLNYLLILGLLLSAVVFAAGIYIYDASTPLLLSASVFFLAFLSCLFFYNRRTMKAEERYLIYFNEERVECKHPEKPDEHVKWKELSQVTVITTDKGPMEPYIWICLTDVDGQALMFPLGAKRSRVLVEKILGLNGLDLKHWAEAMASMENKKFIVWNRSSKT